MRIAALILGLMFAFGEFVQAMLVGSLGRVADDRQTAGAGGLGVLAAFLVLFGAALVLPWPRFAAILFVLAGGLSFLGVGNYPDLGVWGTLSLVLALIAYLGFRGKRKEEAEKAAERAQQRALLARLTALEREG